MNKNINIIKDDGIITTAYHLTGMEYQCLADHSLNRCINADCECDSGECEHWCQPPAIPCTCTVDDNEMITEDSYCELHDDIYTPKHSHSGCKTCNEHDCYHDIYDVVKIDHIIYYANQTRTQAEIEAMLIKHYHIEPNQYQLTNVNVREQQNAVVYNCPVCQAFVELEQYEYATTCKCGLTLMSFGIDNCGQDAKVEFYSKNISEYTLNYYVLDNITTLNSYPTGYLFEIPGMFLDEKGMIRLIKLAAFA